MKRTLNMEVLIFMVKTIGIIGLLILGALIYDIIKYVS